MKEKEKPIVKIISELREEYEPYRLKHSKKEIERWVQQFKKKNKTRELNIDIYFSKLFGHGPTELEKLNIMFLDRSKDLFYYKNKRTSGGYYIIISDLHKDKVNIRIDFADALKNQWYGENNVLDLIEKEIYKEAFKNLQSLGTKFFYINGKENVYYVKNDNTLNKYISELKLVISNYSNVMREYLNKNKELNKKYEDIYNKYREMNKLHTKQGMLFTKYVWAMVFNKRKIEPNIYQDIEIDEHHNLEREDSHFENKEYNFMSNEEFDRIVELLKYKKNIILEGVPGVGKTFIAKKIAKEITEKNEKNIKIIQFHQSYSYEDFIQGLRPTDQGTFEPKDGILKKLCSVARQNIEQKYVMIIDEINRGKISKIFGETFMLIEKDKRATKADIEKGNNSQYAVNLQYSDNELFDIPENVYFIGTMNTMDRSIALMDYALRRRFAVYEIKPCFEDKEGLNNFKQYLNDIKSKELSILAEKIKSINESNDLDEIKFGHSYLCGLNNEANISEKIKLIINYEIIPQLKEYLIGENDKIEKLKDFLDISNEQNLLVDKFLNNRNKDNNNQDGEDIND